MGPKVLERVYNGAHFGHKNHTDFVHIFTLLIEDMIPLSKAVAITRPPAVFRSVRIDVNIGVKNLNGRGETIHPKDFLKGTWLGVVF